MVTRGQTGRAADRAEEVTGPPAWRRGTYWAILLGSWTLVGLFFATRPYVRALALGQPAPSAVSMVPSLADAYFWAAFTPVILWLAGRFPFRRGSWAVPLAVHLAAGVGFATLSVTMNVLVERWILPGEASPFARYFAVTFHWNAMWYGVIVWIGHAIEYYRRYRVRELRASQLETQLARAQLAALKMQLQPHFLFNTLHAISELVHEDPRAADRMISRLGTLLRLSIDNAGLQEIPLQQELEFLCAYLEIEQIRFGDRLRVELDIPPDTLDARVPNLLLQPLVENAIRHGTAPRREPGWIRISSERLDGSLVLSVADNGAGLPTGGAVLREGVGLRNTRARLEQMYGPAHRFELWNRNGGGVVARVMVPFAEATGEPGARERNGDANDPGTGC